MSRTGNSAKNILTSFAGQLLNNALRFICRTIFIYYLGEKFLGINSLYANVLTIFSVSELGFSSAITYSLYAPLAKGDTAAVASLMAFIKKAYHIIGLVILAVGLCMMPFLPKLMRGSSDVINIYEYYLLYLAQSVLSYEFFAYKGVLLAADQKRYVSDAIIYVVQVSMNALQILSILTLRSFLVYTLLSIVSTLVQNIAISIATDKRYPYIKEPAAPLSREQKKAVFAQVYAKSLYKMSTVVGTSTDNLIISSAYNYRMVGYYDNYNYVIQTIQKFVSGFFDSFTSSLGNYYVLESKEQNEFMFRCMNLLNSWLVVFCSVCFAALLQPWIAVWIGEKWQLSTPVMMVIVYNFATNYMQSAVQIYKDASGLFVRGKYRPVATAVINLGVSILLVRTIGLAGVFLGSIIARLTTTWCYDSWLVYRVGFGKSPAGYFANCGLIMALIYLLTVVINALFSPFSLSAVTELILRLLVCLVLPNAALFAVYGRSKEFAFILDKGRSFIGRKLHRH